MKRKINKDTIVDVKLYNFISCEDKYNIIKEDTYEKYFFGIFNELVAKKGQLYNKYYHHYEELDAETHVIKNGIVYELPEIVITTADSNKTRIYFDDYESALNYYTNLTNDIKYLEI